ncbi:MAG: helix-turn-helix domain-containing protein [Pseudorhodoferax sp.]
MSENKEAVGVVKTPTAYETKSQRKFSPKSTHSEAQRERIVAALRVRPQTSYDLRRLGCYQAPARVKELRDRFGYKIETTRITLVDRDGYLHPRAALYSLVAEPNV